MSELHHYEIHIEPAETQDVRQLVGILESFYGKATQLHTRSFDPEVVATTVFRYITEDHQCLFVARQGERILGCLLGYVSWSDWANELVAFEEVWYVDPEARNLRCGYTLIEAFKKWAKDKGAVDTIMNIASGLIDNEAISKSMGFTPLGTVVRV